MNWNKAETTPPTEEALLIWLDDGTFCVGVYETMDFFDEDGEWLPHATHWMEITPPAETV